MSPNMKKSMRFFGDFALDMPRVPVPFGMQCIHCTIGFTEFDRGVVYVHERACVASHSQCYADAALLRWQQKYLWLPSSS